MSSTIFTYDHGTIVCETRQLMNDSSEIISKRVEPEINQSKGLLLTFSKNETP